nr:hypothetical protein [Streptomyces antibioticus]
MTIPSSISVPSIGITAKMAGAPTWLAVLCVLAGAVVALIPQVLAHGAQVLGHRDKRTEMQNIDDRRRDIVTAAAALPPEHYAAVLSEVARGLVHQDGLPPPADPAAPGRSP